MSSIVFTKSYREPAPTEIIGILLKRILRDPKKKLGFYRIRWLQQP
ncbi:MAG: hypothetical protein MUE44_01530 [Oscillatoriaceae cyanobacterium Prado104]|jgi:hypothetical protein|nr:hypothetical protein [Oscillatoriaceae cyanobacterium Prado104]